MNLPRWDLVAAAEPFSDNIQVKFLAKLLDAHAELVFRQSDNRMFCLRSLDIDVWVVGIGKAKP